jgi:hypothetical protein
MKYIREDRLIHKFGEDKVFCVGLSRTGTTSIGHAGNILGYKAVHNNVPMVWSLSDGNIVMLHGSDTLNFFVDEPYFTLWETFYTIYPRAKFILTTRDLSSWVPAIKDMVKNHQVRWDKKIRKFQIRFWNLNPKYYKGEIDDGYLINWYFKHNGKVVNTIPSDQLLVLPSEIPGIQKWEKLCKFLDKPIPDVEYPHLNA